MVSSVVEDIRPVSYLCFSLFLAGFTFLTHTVRVPVLQSLSQFRRSYLHSIVVGLSLLLISLRFFFLLAKQRPYSRRPVHRCVRFEKQRRLAYLPARREYGLRFLHSEHLKECESVKHRYACKV